ncbi:M15 family metallopeptidase [Microbacterium kyungheense]|uniref:D-alanyl-D-alanine carboxypeptidase-like protein n=1 Tax=Microbacterium kyungheense TaxID=1263636 RepID=A0A543F2X1_9MICO|nr:M15 family metallopeptidase [Microbacterium kyungheense]TQM28168.1 D-alanyl-D-alanine carboxypeptidase-like protein [Microbacterium kyungheense]
MHSTPHPARVHRALAGIVVALALITAAVAGLVAYRAAAAAQAPAAGATSEVDETHDGAVTEADGILPDSASPFDDASPGVARLQPALLDALRRAATDAAAQGVDVRVNSGWRSAEYQQQLLQEAVAQYGSEAEAARWVATPTASAHVAGEAVDIGPYAAADWMIAHGQDYGLCRTYDNEAWHFELYPDAVQNGCPRPYRDPTEDPRMQG